MPVDFIAKILDDLTEEDDWIQLGTLGQNISKLRPAFDPRLYGCRKLSDLIAGQPKRFDLESRGSSATGGKDLTCACASPPSTSALQLGCASAASQQTRSRPSCLARYSAASARRSRLSGVSLGLSSATPALRV